MGVLAPKNSRLRVFLVVRSKGRLDCFMIVIVPPQGLVRHSDRHGVLQTIPRVIRLEHLMLFLLI
jgi:hypothetical protein